jgi:ubiquitin-small subunit ribosomal protein S27Ae
MPPKKETKVKETKKGFARYKMYKVSGDKLEKHNKPCPKCGTSSYLANHKNRLTCGKCGYVESK